MSVDTVTVTSRRSLEGSRRKSPGAISTMSTSGYIMSSTVYILAPREKITPTYGACMWRRPRRPRVG